MPRWLFRTIVASLFAFVLGVWLSFWFWWGPLVEGKTDARGQWGDSFGAINALFSALAFAGLIITVLLQREELKAQRAELRETRDVLKRTAEAQEQSQAALNAQGDYLARSAKAQALAAVAQISDDDLARLAKVRLQHLQRDGGPKPTVADLPTRIKEDLYRQRAAFVAEGFDQLVGDGYPKSRVQPPSAR